MSEHFVRGGAYMADGATLKTFRIDRVALAPGDSGHGSQIEVHGDESLADAIVKLLNASGLKFGTYSK